jgi:hypothetical protein
METPLKMCLPRYWWSIACSIGSISFSPVQGPHKAYREKVQRYAGEEKGLLDMSWSLNLSI